MRGIAFPGGIPHPPTAGPQQGQSLAALAHVSRTNVSIPSNIATDTSAVMHRWCTGKTATVLAGTHGFESREGTFC